MTPKERAAMQQALEALEVSTDWDVGAKGKQLQSMKAITALREALKPTREGKYYYKDNACTADNADSPDCICWHDEALAEQAEQEPVAEIIGFERTNDIRGVKRIPRIKWNVPLWEDESPLQLGNLYTHHVRTKDLTDDEIEWLVVDTLETWNSKDTMKDFARAVIAADRSKNK